MPELSAGLVLYRWRSGVPELLLVHPGGPYWAKKITAPGRFPKAFTALEQPLEAARREFEEETGCKPPDQVVELGQFRQPSGKIISVWAGEGDFDLNRFQSNTFSMEWPPRSGRVLKFPEADRVGWFEPKVALGKILMGQTPIVRALTRLLTIGE